MSTGEWIKNQEHNSQDKCELSSSTLLALLKYIEQSDRVQIFLITNGTFLKTQTKFLEQRKFSGLGMTTEKAHKLTHWTHTPTVKGEMFKRK